MSSNTGTDATSKLAFENVLIVCFDPSLKWNCCYTSTVMIDCNVTFWQCSLFTTCDIELSLPHNATYFSNLIWAKQFKLSAAGMGGCSEATIPVYLIMPSAKRTKSRFGVRTLFAGTAGCSATGVWTSGDPVDRVDDCRRKGDLARLPGPKKGFMPFVWTGECCTAGCFTSVGEAKLASSSLISVSWSLFNVKRQSTTPGLHSRSLEVNTSCLASLQLIHHALSYDNCLPCAAYLVRLDGNLKVLSLFQVHTKQYYKNSFLHFLSSLQWFGPCQIISKLTNSTTWVSLSCRQVLV